MEAEYYTLAQWRVRPAREADFVARWDHLSELFSQLPAPPVWGTLLQNEADPQLFYSFGPWQRDADIQAMRTNPAVQAAFAALKETCIDMTPGTYRRVRHVVVAPKRGA